MARSGSQLQEMEDAFIGEKDYDKDLKLKIEQRKLVGNLLESKQQSQISKFGGEMLSTTEHEP